MTTRWRTKWANKKSPKARSSDHWNWSLFSGFSWSRRLTPSTRNDRIKSSRVWSRQPVYKKNRLRDRFYSSKSRQVSGQAFSGTSFKQESWTGFKEKNRTCDSFLDRTWLCSACKPVSGPVSLFNSCSAFLFKTSPWKSLSRNLSRFWAVKLVSKPVFWRQVSEASQVWKALTKWRNARNKARKKCVERECADQAAVHKLN